MLLDTHFHLDFVPLTQRAGLLADLETLGVRVIPQTVLPSTFEPGMSLGFHPWWITSAEQAARELDIFASHVGRTKWIGEIGLDFAPCRVGTAELQRQVLGEIFRLVSADQVMSIHAVRSVTAVLDMLHEVPATPVFHWFSGTSDELTAVVRAGGYISVNPRMLESKRGRAYVKQIPADRLLLETDLPASGETVSADTVAGLLEGTVDQLSGLRGSDMREIIIENQRRLYG